MNATWTPATSPDLASQSIQFHDNPWCTSTYGSPTNLPAATTQHLFPTGVPDRSYTFVITSTYLNGESEISACSSAMTIDTAAPMDATSLSWNEVSPHPSADIKASWTRSPDDDLAAQKIQFHSNSTCTNAVSPELNAGSVSTYSWSASGAGTYYYKVTSIDLLGNTSVSGCSSPMIVANTPFLHDWSFNAFSEALYSFVGSVIEISYGLVRLISTDQLDHDNSLQGFGGGSMDGVEWDSSRSFLRLRQGGNPTNRSGLEESWTPKWSNIVNYWKFDGPGGSISHGASLSAEIGSGGTVSGSSLQFTSGKLNSALTAGTSGSSYIQVSNASAYQFPDNSFSVGTWFRSSRTDVAESVIGWWGSPQYIVLHVGADNILRLDGKDSADAGNYLSASFPIVRDGSWHHIVGVRDKANQSMRLYYDGRLVTDAMDTRTGGFNASQVTIGKISDPSSIYLQGSIDDIAVWNTALSPSDVAILYSRQSAAYSGKFTSRVMDALSTGQSWTALSWIPTLPFFKPLPDFVPGSTQSEISADYSALASDDLMNGLVGLWHLDETDSTAGDPNDFKDSSGNGLHGKKLHGVTFGAMGRFGNGAKFNGIPPASPFNLEGNAIMVSEAPALHPTSSIAISAWFSLDSSDVTRDFHIVSTTHSGGYSLGVTKSGAVICPESLCFQARAINPDDSSTTRYYSAAIPRNDLKAGKWYHVVGTLDGSNIKLHLNGTAVATTSWPGGEIQYSYPSNPFCIGADAKISDCFDGGYFKGMIDEVAVWNRGLNNAEVQQLYRRGANRLKHQVRACSAWDCSDDSIGANWKGPDGTNQSYFSELQNRSIQAAISSGTVNKGLPSILFSNFINQVGPSRYFQYRTILESDDSQQNLSDGTLLGRSCNYEGFATWCSPELKSLKVAPDHYDSTAPSVVTKGGINYSDLSNFTDTLGSSCAGGIGYNLGVGANSSSATWYWWNGTAWTLADGTVSQSSSASAVKANITSFRAYAGAGTLYLKAYLKSSGTTPCELDNVNVTGVQ